MQYTLETIGQCASYAHACVNPVIYTFALPTIRRQLWNDFKALIVRDGGIPCCTIRKKSQVTKRSDNDACQPLDRGAVLTEMAMIDSVKLAKSELKLEATSQKPQEEDVL